MAFQVGTYVQIKGLSKKPEYNGFTGKIFVEKNDEDRWGVEFFYVGRMNSLKTILAKEDNLGLLCELPKPLPRSGKVLLLDGFGMFGAKENFVTKALFASDPAFFQQCGVVHVGLQDENPKSGELCEKAILAACANPADFRAIVDCKLFRAWFDDYKAEEDQDEAPTIAYFGDVNAEDETQTLMLKLLAESPISVSIPEGTDGTRMTQTDQTCFVCGTESGFRVYSTDPFHLTFRREDGGGLGVVCMLFRTNILAFTGGGKNPRFQPQNVVLWDDRNTRIMAELRFKTPVRSVQLRRDLVVVATSNKVWVYGFKTLSLLHSIETTENPKGLCCLSSGERILLLCPGMQQGSVLATTYPSGFGDPAVVEKERNQILHAHDSPIAAMAVDQSCSLIATASEKGTIVRVHEIHGDGKPQELRRGLDRAEIHSLAFSPSGDFLVASSDKGTVHVFALRTGGGEDATNSKSSLKRLSRVLPVYFSSEWSFAQFRVHDYRNIAAFSAQSPHTVIIVCANGSYYKVRFDPSSGGEMIREEYHQFDGALEGREIQVPTALGDPGT
ncbi:Autophagy-related protein 18a (AtATG18a) (Protein PEROXISOME UNUSUAL POSITIONING 2) [Durusdinium trenchii]|uniref:Autophagy-related protein 18a (AtATG18a) (Protein PEROXISOME UNUSUAL POSITIONING 2) n=1 Tax=Durusdinium trenchii TaxID=1381693 RepID=A0ABP0S7F4_9DINO